LLYLKQPSGLIVNTQELFREDAYLRQCTANITGVSEHGIELDRTVFYPMGGGQLGDRGSLVLRDGSEIAIVDTTKGEAVGQIYHITSEPVQAELLGQQVTARIDWDRRYRMMRVHTLLHLLCSAVDAEVTGGSIRDNGTGRLDFDLPESTLNKEEITAKLNALIDRDQTVLPRWVDEDELDSNPGLVRTMSVAPPRGQGRVRLLEIEDVDLQACGGTHVARTGEIGPVAVGKIEKKGKQNRRVNVRLSEL
jgi:misacylated tRNA(Ala) deacylase